LKKNNYGKLHGKETWWQPDGKYHGQGTFTYPDGRIEKGIWENNECISGNC